VRRRDSLDPHVDSITFAERRPASSTNGENGPREIQRRTRNLFHSNFPRVGNEANFLIRKTLEEHGFNVPEVAFLNAWIFLNVPCNSGLDCFH